MGVVLATVLAGGMYVAGEGQREAVERRFEGEEERQRAWATIARLEQEESTLPQSAFRWALADERVSTVSSGAASVAGARGSGAGRGYGAAGALVGHHYLRFLSGYCRYCIKLLTGNN